VRAAARPAVSLVGTLVFGLSCGSPPPEPGSAAPDAGAPQLAAEAGAGPAKEDAEHSANHPDDARALLKAAESAGCGLTIGDIAVYQGVKSVLVHDGVEVRYPEVAVVQRRAALVRVFLTPSPAWKTAEVQASLTITTKAGHKVLSDKRRIAAASSDGDLESTLDFDVPGEALVDGASYAVELASPSACAAVRFPAKGNAPMASRRVGVLKIKLVPIRYTADHSDRLPDTSDGQLAEMRARLLAMYPVEKVELSVRAPVKTSIAVTGAPDGWNDLLDSLRDLRAADGPDPEVFYFGLVSPAETVAAYCPDQCYLGLSFRTDKPAAKYQAGVGLGFSGEIAVAVLAHELGHLAGRKHAPCKVSTYLDPQYPQADGKTGSWGWDARTRSLYAPDATRDLMGYCNPAWISAYTYRGVMDRIADVAGGGTKPATLEPSPAGRTLLVGPSGARWGRPASGTPEGTSERADILDAAGNLVSTVEVWRSELGEEGQWSVQVPEPQPGWHSLRLGDGPPIPFDTASAVPALQP
jgi:hypothetical protein